jgi:hypothetical protein
MHNRPWTTYNRATVLFHYYKVLLSYRPWTNWAKSTNHYTVQPVHGRLCMIVKPCSSETKQLLGYMWGLAFYPHVENTCMTASFHLEAGLGPLDKLDPVTFFLSKCLYQARILGDHVFVCWGVGTVQKHHTVITVPKSNRKTKKHHSVEQFQNLIELFRQCGVFCFYIRFWNCSDSVVFFVFLLDFGTVLTVWCFLFFY